jgi:hypothetical protein
MPVSLSIRSRTVRIASGLCAALACPAATASTHTGTLQVWAANIAPCPSGRGGASGTGRGEVLSATISVVRPQTASIAIPSSTASAGTTDYVLTLATPDRDGGGHDALVSFGAGRFRADGLCL